MSKPNVKIGYGLVVATLALWCLAWWWAPVDRHQGDVYRIIYLHVPAAFSAFLAGFALLVHSVRGLRQKSQSVLLQALASAEVGLLFTILTLATGAIWGKPTWGTWWTWDARLTTTLLLGILYAGYILLYQSLTPGPERVTACSVLGILIFADIPIIYKSVVWWRTLHQPQTILRPGGSATMDSEMYYLLIAGIVLMLSLALWLMRMRAYNLELRAKLEQSSLAMHRESTP